MDNPNEKRLTEFLGMIGFSGEKLEQDLRSHMELGMPFFTIHHTIPYGSEVMRFKLGFKMDQHFSAYHFTEYEAIYRRPVSIRHTVVNGIDTERLEEQMKAVDWSVPIDPMQMKDLVAWRTYADKVNDLCNQLWKLSENDDREGSVIQDQLRVKYWADTPFDTSSELQELRNVYEEKQRFTLTENGMCNVTLAYHILSGKLEDISGRFLDLGIDVHSRLENKLSNTSDEFSIDERISFPEGSVAYSFTVIKDYTGRYNILPYTATLSKYPVISHAVYGTIDSKELAERMAEINWKNSYETFVMKKFWDREAMYQNVRAIFEQVMELDMHPEGKTVAAQLKNKYWTDAPFFKDFVEEPEDNDIEKPVTVIFPAETGVATAYNLLCGRAVCSRNHSGDMEGTANWYRLDFAGIADGSKYALAIIAGFRRSNTLEGLLQMIPVISYPGDKIANAKEILLNGGLLEVVLRNNRPVLIMANPLQNTLNVYSRDMKPIPVNLEMDPDWVPEVSIQSKYLIRTMGTL